jgi:SNF2 family DNA or RNA helicase
VSKQFSKENNQDTSQISLNNFTVPDLTEEIISQHSSVSVTIDPLAHHYIVPKLLELNHGVFLNSRNAQDFPPVKVIQEEGMLFLTCDCKTEHKQLCEHQAIVLSAILKKEDLRVFYDNNSRHEKLKSFAADYGLEQEPNLDNFFTIRYEDKKLQISPKSPELLRVTKESLDHLKSIIVDNAVPPPIAEDQPVVIVLKQHKYYKYLLIELYQGQRTKGGKVKNPLTLMPPLDFIWNTDDGEHLKFYTAVHKFQNHQNKNVSQADIQALKAVVKNPLKYDFYYHDSEVSENVTATSILTIKVGLLEDESKLTVDSKEQFFELSGSIEIDKQLYALKNLKIWFTYFVRAGDALYLVNNVQTLNVIGLLSKKEENLLVHVSKFQEFKNRLLSKIEERMQVDYKHIPIATPVQLIEEGFDKDKEKIIYLSDFGSHVMIIPVMRYGEVEISIRTKKLIYTTDAKGKEFMVQRDENEENNFTSLLIKQHPYFQEQLSDPLHYFYLHKKHFLNEDWFLNVFEEWRRHDITILGFNELEGNKLNPHKVKITINVISGINWFNSTINARFGKTKAKLKQVYRAVTNRTKYVQLDDGTLGILPDEWLEKFTDYFNSGEIEDDETLRISKSNYTAIEQLFQAEMLDEKVKAEISNYHQTLKDFDHVKTVPVPAEFQGKLRPYQEQGLSWLNFLDDFGFGGCLADDMGLGKSVQIIAFILSLRRKVKQNTNLLIVPTSLIFNWQQEINKFAPSIQVFTLYGADRIRSIAEFDKYEVILTSYGTLLSDVFFLKEYVFNYVLLDESQQIKNPESQRYKAACLLKSRNRIVLTGTPIENNTFDLFGQFSFACPGLLGSKAYFKRLYSAPIDMFKSRKRTIELQNKIKPFMLRRSKQEVASELPEKTEMVLYCEMKPEQRNIYDIYEKEFRDYIAATTGEELKKKSMHVLKGITKLRQICDSPELIKGEKMPGNASAKIELLIEEIEGKIHQHKILVFSQFVSMLELIRKELLSKNIGFAYLTGQTRNRQSVIEKFQQDDTIRVFLISLKAGGTGLNLTQADYVYLVDPWWNPAVENQAIDRCHRIGQDKKIVAVRLICPGTVEEKIMVMQQNKNDLAGNLVKTDNYFFNKLGKDGLLNLLS